MSRPRARPLRSLPAGILLGVLTFGAFPAGAVDFGVRAGGYLEDHDPFVGLELLHRLGGSNWYFNPNIEFVFADERDRVAASFDFHYDLRTRTAYTLWAGGGPAAIFREGQGRSGGETDFGIDLLGGIGWPLQGLTPFAQLKIVLSDDSEVAAAVGVRF